MSSLVGYVCRNRVFGADQTRLPASLARLIIGMSAHRIHATNRASAGGTRISESIYHNLMGMSETQRTLNPTAREKDILVPSRQMLRISRQLPNDIIFWEHGTYVQYNVPTKLVT
jgi:hypothetical protein